MRMTLKLIGVVGLTWLSVQSGFAGEWRGEDSTAQLPEGWTIPLGAGSKLTAFDAACHVFPGATKDSSGNLVLVAEKVLRVPGTSKERSVLPEGTTLEPPTLRKVRGQGRNYNVLMWDGHCPESTSDRVFGDQVTILGVFPEGSAEPTDVAEIKSDQFTFFGGDSLIHLGVDDAFTIINHHSNAGEPYEAIALFHLRDGRLRRITEIFTVGEFGGCEKAFREEVEWRTEPDANGGYPNIIITAIIVHAPSEFQDGCDKKVRERRERFEDTFVWDATKARYGLTKGTIKKFDAWNEKNM